MKLTTRVRYSVRFMIDLTIHGHKGQVLAKDISKRQQISEKYLGHFVPLLKNNGLIQAQRGVKGGFSLAKPASKITLKDIIEAVEGPIVLTDCVNNIAACKRSSDCIMRDIWQEVGEKMAGVVEEYSLEKMAERQQEKLESLSYTI